MQVMEQGHEKSQLLFRIWTQQLAHLTNKFRRVSNAPSSRVILFLPDKIGAHPKGDSKR